MCELWRACASPLVARKGRVRAYVALPMYVAMYEGWAGKLGEEANITARGVYSTRTTQIK